LGKDRRNEKVKGTEEGLPMMSSMFEQEVATERFEEGEKDSKDPLVDIQGLAERVA
jgi:hypothetical protein